MIKKYRIFVLFGLLLMALSLFIASGCGDDKSSTTADCDIDADSLIPDPSGKPQHVYFFRDT